jgi:hypothetical protein
MHLLVISKYKALQFMYFVRVSKIVSYIKERTLRVCVCVCVCVYVCWGG